jgi:FlaG/FlaF family flagellin (archaellin)
MRKGLSPIISVTILVVIAISIASFVAPWMYGIVTDMTNQTGTGAEKQVRCMKAGLDFDSSYGDYGVDYNISTNATEGESDWIKAKIVNTGSIDLYGFTMEVTLETDSSEAIEYYELTDATQLTSSDPLRPSRSAIIEANLTSDINESESTLKSVKVISQVCPEAAPSVEL